jgi:hypothetical protein
VVGAPVGAERRGIIELHERWVKLDAPLSAGSSTTPASLRDACFARRGEPLASLARMKGPSLLTRYLLFLRAAVIAAAAVSTSGSILA